MDKLKSYFVTGSACLIVGALLGFLGPRACEVKSSPLPSDGTVSKETFTSEVPLVAYNKQQLRKKGVISKDVAKDTDAAVLTVGQVLDDSGSRNIAVVFDKKTGETRQEEKRPFAEKMSRFEIGLGYGLVSGDIAKAAQFRATLGRIGPVYFTGQAEGFIVDRPENRHPWNAMAFVNMRF